MTSGCTVLYSNEKDCVFMCFLGIQLEVTSYQVLNLRRRKKERSSSNSLMLGITWCTNGCSRPEYFASKDINHNGKLSLAEIDKVPRKCADLRHPHCTVKIHIYISGGVQISDKFA